jgi:hypothetical protein
MAQPIAMSDWKRLGVAANRNGQDAGIMAADVSAAAARSIQHDLEKVDHQAHSRKMDPEVIRLEERIAAQEERANLRLEAAMARLDGTFARIDGQFQTMNARSDGQFLALAAKIDGQFNTLNERLSGIEKATSGTKMTIIGTAIGVIALVVAVMAYGQSWFGSGLSVQETIRGTVPTQRSAPPSP